MKRERKREEEREWEEMIRASNPKTRALEKDWKKKGRKKTYNTSIKNKPFRMHHMLF